MFEKWGNVVTTNVVARNTLTTQNDWMNKLKISVIFGTYCNQKHITWINTQGNSANKLLRKTGDSAAVYDAKCTYLLHFHNALPNCCKY